MFSSIGKTIVLLGLGLVILGLIILGFAKIGVPFGNLPGDIKVERKNFAFYFPLVSFIILSVLLTVIVNVVLRFLKR
ncbi:MAG: hypothetical protein B6D63_02265 [Candidatus Latescibacteria bacterium 4484_7]|nr:MAG: hypothetical protein B6D63_02265 [Candidatus Latescibacteria bacterium 4484_7]RKZ08324.1 MAG: DUF2905 domain-containing protein [bacterium]